MMGSQLKTIRRRLELSVDEMARLLGAQGRTYYRYEKARRVPLTIERFVVTLLKNPSVLWAEIKELRSAD